jgi:hypothetical protein
MKFLIPLLALCLSTAGLAETSTWQTLTKIGDELKIERGQIALVVSVSEPIYLVIHQPQRSSKGLRLRPPESRQCYYTQSLSRDYVNRRTQVASWNRPFPISGPCNLRLGTSAVMTVRVISTD